MSGRRQIAARVHTGAAASTRPLSFLIAALLLPSCLQALVTWADEAGYYRVCHVPERELLIVVGVDGGVATEPDTLKIEEHGGVVEHTLEVRRKR